MMTPPYPLMLCLGCGKVFDNTYRQDLGKLCRKCRRVKGS